MAAEASDDHQLTALDRFFDPHKPVGVDNEGRVHHFVADYGREYTFEADGGRVYVVGDDGLEHVEDLGDRSVSEWMLFVEKELCGWDDVHLLTINFGDVVDKLRGESR